jgi:hypothetical protein
MLQVQPVPVAATRHDSRYIERSETGRRFPGVKNAAAGALDGIDVGTGDSGYSGCSLQQVEQRPLGPEDWLQLSANDPDD